jgi:transposase
MLWRIFWKIEAIVLYDLREDHWERIKDILPGKVGNRGRAGYDNRGFIRAVMWVARTGATWRALPKEYVNSATVHKRFTRGAKALIWQKIFNALG